MGGSDENHPLVIRKSNTQETLRHGSEKIPVAATGHGRRALAAITNTLGTTPHPYAVHKRGLLKEQNAVINKKPNVPVHRPITRKFAAQMACKQQQQPFIKGTKPPIQQEDSKTKDNKVSSDYDVPMSVKHTEVMLEEMVPMDEETEMEDVDQKELVVDIDTADKKNPLAVVEYIDGIYNHYKKTESCSCVPPNYMEQQCDVNEKMRGILIDWLIEVHYKFELMEETLFLTVSLMDRFLSVQQVARKKLQLVGVTAMLIACKYEEVSVPIVEDLILISDRAYCRQEVLDMEKLMANTLEFNFSFPTPYVFMRRFLKVAQSDKQLEMLSFYMIELCLVEYEMLRFPPSLLAAAAIFAAQCTISKTRQWSMTSERHTKYNEEQLLECAKLMVSNHQKAGKGRLNGVYKKYSTWKYGYAAKSEPADFLLV